MMRFCLLFFISIYSTVAFSIAIYGHRGARGLSPENTLPSYQVALKHGVNYVDMDVVMTKDREVVVYHDIALSSRVTRDKHRRWVKDDTILIKDLTLRELQQYDVGRLNPKESYARYFPNQRSLDKTRIPTLKEVIQYVKKQKGDKVGFQIEIKTDPARPDDTYSAKEIAKAVGKIIEAEHITERTEVQAFDWNVLFAMQKAYPNIATAYLTSEERVAAMKSDDPAIAGQWTGRKLLRDYRNSVPFMIASLGGKLWDPQDTEVTKDLVEEAHRLGLKVVVWSWPERVGTEFNPQLVRQLIDMGVDGIITDRPDKLKKMLG